MFDLSKHTPRKLSHGASLDKTTPRKVKSKAQEKRVAVLGGGKRQPGSGNGIKSEAKGDVRGVKNYLIECKRTDAAWIYVEPKVFPKIIREAAKLQKIPLVQLDIDGRKEGETRSWFLMPGAVAGISTVVVKETKGSGLNLTVTNLRRMDAALLSGALPVFYIGRPKDVRGLAGMLLDQGMTSLWTAFPESAAKKYLGL